MIASAARPLSFRGSTSMPNLRASYALGQFPRPLPIAATFFGCNKCQTRIASSESLLSVAFRGFSGRAALFKRAKNVVLDAPAVLLMDTGAHTVQNIFCAGCSLYLGWKFLRACEREERWKEGTVLLEMELLTPLTPLQSSRTSTSVSTHAIAKDSPPLPATLLHDLSRKARYRSGVPLPFPPPKMQTPRSTSGTSESSHDSDSMQSVSLNAHTLQAGAATAKGVGRSRSVGPAVRHRRMPGILRSPSVDHARQRAVNGQLPG